MYSFITGKVVDLTPTQVILEAGHIGYEIEISVKAYEEIKDRQEIKLFIQQIVREDAHSLYGFQDIMSKNLFKKLISVSGIGPNTARLILSGMSTEEAVHAVRQENDLAFKKVKGVGPKTAKRIILDLKDKLNDIGIDHIYSSKDTVLSNPDNTIYDDALSALTTLGYKRAQVAKAVKNAMTHSAEDLRVETVIKTALKALNSGG